LHRCVQRGQRETQLLLTETARNKTQAGGGGATTQTVLLTEKMPTGGYGYE